MRGTLRLGTIALLLAACTSSPSPSPAVHETGGPGATSGPPATAGTPVILPPGAQFEPAETMPASGNWGWVYLANDGLTLMSPGRGADGAFRLAVSTSAGSWEDRPFIDADIPAPKGYDPDKLDNGWSRAFVADMASGPLGTVAVGTREFRSSSGYPTVRSAAWFSKDLVTWKRTVLADVVGAGKAVQVTGVAVDANGFVAVATVGSIDLKGPSSIVVIRSANGVDWTLAATIDSPFSLAAAVYAHCATSWLVACRTPLLQQDGRLILAGTEFVCDTNAGGLFPTRRDGIRFGSQLRLWSSSDAGTTWAPVDLDRSGIGMPIKAAPTTLDACPPYTTIEAAQAFDADIRTVRFFAGAVGGQVVVVDSQRAAVSTDLAAWVAGDLPGAVPAGGYPIGSEPGPKMLVVDTQGLAIVSLEPQRNGSDLAVGPAYQAIVWRSVDGAAWERLDALPRPIVIKTTTDRLKLLGDNLAVLLAGGTIYRSHGGPLVPWTP